MKKRKAWVISVDMGYGHQRAAYPLKDVAYDRIITANSDKLTTRKEEKQWKRFKRFYEGVSRFRSFPVIGRIIWKLYDKLQRINPFYPFRDLSKPTISSRYIHRLIRKGFIKSIIDHVEDEKKLPIINTFFVTAIAAAHKGVKENYCIVTDSDINRIWVPEDPKKERLFYCTPTLHSTRRIQAYGVPKKNIFFTGFPLPKENTGKGMAILKKDLGNRLPNLDPRSRYLSRYKEVIVKDLGSCLRKKSDHPLTITFAVGGAGAQKEIGASILKSFAPKIKKGRVRVNLVAGTRPEVDQYFRRVVQEAGLERYSGKGVTRLCTMDKKEHFKLFNSLLHKTDILWTKPSELSFYTALGLPIIIAPPLGYHEILNMKWLVRMGAGIRQENPEYADEWISEWLDKGFLAEAAWEGYTEAPKYGTYNIEKVAFSRNREKSRLGFRY
ncbi:hypothetical protein GF351_01000 [Candidatus Woesearchaeota archaeon]|nr:hypothetical protein [Candidatus Woesearchaeota archaeon]